MVENDNTNTLIYTTKEHDWLNQMQNSADLTYQFIDKKNKVTLAGPMTCKDYINDLIISKYNKKDFLIHGFDTKTLDFSENEDFSILLYNGGNGKLSELNRKLIPDYIHQLEEIIKIRKSEFRVTANGKLECTLNKFWVSEPYLMSMLMNMIRFFIECNREKSIKVLKKEEKDFINAVMTHNYEILKDIKLENINSFSSWLLNKISQTSTYTPKYNQDNGKSIFKNLEINLPFELLLSGKMIKQKEFYKNEIENYKKYKPSDIHNNFGISTFNVLLKQFIQLEKKNIIDKYICEITEQQDITMKEESVKKLKEVQE